MNSTVQILTLNALAILLFTSCSSPPQQNYSPAQMQAIKLNEQGIAAELRGDYQKAADTFSEAYRLQGSIENFQGMVVALINRSRLIRLQGNPVEAEKSIDEAVALLPQAEELSAEICFEKAKVLFAQKKLPEALKWSERSTAASDSMNKGRFENLSSEINLASGDSQMARIKAAEALKHNRDTDDRHEEANSLRLLAEIHLNAKEWMEARGRFTEALLIEKDLGNSGKIAKCLRGLARTSKEMGKNKEALDYYKRAASVSMLNGDNKSAGLDYGHIADIFESSGEAEQAANARKKSKELLEPPPN